MSITLVQPPLFNGPASAAYLMEEILNAWQNPDHQRFLTGWAKDFYASRIVGDGVTDIVGRRDGGRWLNTLDRWINQSPLYAVEEEVAALIQVGAESMPEQKLLQSDLPSRSGMLLLPRPVGVLDKNLNVYPISGVFWLPAVGESVDRGERNPGIMTVHFTTNNDLARDDYEWPKVHPDFPPLTILHIMFLPFGTEMVTETGTAPEADASIRRFIKHLQSFWAFVQQKVVEVETTQMPRPIRKRAEKQDRKVSELKVVRLRRLARESVKPAPEGGKEIHWSHRWVVRGHWRNQFYASLNDHRAVWIYPFIKGPTEKPLRMRKTIFDVRR